MNGSGFYSQFISSLRCRENTCFDVTGRRDGIPSTRWKNGFYAIFNVFLSPKEHVGFFRCHGCMASTVPFTSRSAMHEQGCRIARLRGMGLTAVGLRAAMFPEPLVARVPRFARAALVARVPRFARAALVARVPRFARAALVPSHRDWCPFPGWSDHHPGARLDRSSGSRDFHGGHFIAALPCIPRAFRRS